MAQIKTRSTSPGLEYYSTGKKKKKRIKKKKKVKHGPTEYVIGFGYN